MALKRYIVTAGIVTAASVAGLAGVVAAHAATNGNGKTETGLVEAIASKFNLKASDVQSVFDDERGKMEADREQKVKDSEAQLVKDGKLTQEQVDKIDAKRSELKAEREANREAGQNLTKDERQAKMKEHKTAIEAWLKENGIDSQYTYLLAGGGRGGHGDGPRSMR